MNQFCSATENGVNFYRELHVVLARYCYRNVVRPSVRDVDVRWAYRLDKFEVNYTNN